MNDNKENLLESATRSAQGDALASDICNLIYPVGSIYINVNATNPSSNFGGIWTAFGAGRTLVGVDGSQVAFQTALKEGGEVSHKLSVEELPSYNLSENNGYGIDWAGGHNGNVGYANSQNQYAQNAWSQKVLSSKGKDQPHNNLQPYITVYMWRRTA